MGTRVIGNAKVVILATCQVNFLARWIIRVKFRQYDVERFERY